jgi:hypothetical protein
MDVAIECTINYDGICLCGNQVHHKCLCGDEGGVMSGRRVLPEQKLDYHINFTLQQSVGQDFADICKEESATIQEKLRYLVNEYVEWKREQE